MLKEKIGTVTEDEKKVMQDLHERGMALRELSMTLDNGMLSEDEGKNIYEMIVNDLSKNIKLMEEWWKEKENKYNWKSLENCKWTIDFENNDILLISNS